MIKNKEYFTTYEARNYLMVSHSTVIEWIKSGKLKATRTLGGHRRITRKALERFMRKNGMSFLKEENRRILIVDDDKDRCLLFKKILEKENFVVYVTSDGFEAGVLAIHHDPALIILDLKMRGIDGFAACRLIKSNSLLNDVKILVLTGYTSDENVQKVLGWGADRCLAEPIEKENLLKEVRTLLGLFSVTQGKEKGF